MEVLQYELRAAGGGGRTFVRGVRDYVKRYSQRPGATREAPVPPEHVLVFDEAQRAFDADKMQDTHVGHAAKSEPEQFIEFANRVPEWCVVLGLIGSGQEIHVGEEAGIGQWRTAVEASTQVADWTIHVPPSVHPDMKSSSVTVEVEPALSLDTELRFHFAQNLHTFVAGLLGELSSAELSPMAAELEGAGFHLRITQSLDQAKSYLRERYGDDPNARFGLLASAKDKDLIRFGIPNDFQATKQVKFGPWYGDSEHDYAGMSCRRLERCVTEFGAQGLELDASLLAWGTDLRREGGQWSNARARGYKRGAKVVDPYQLRVNAYRVLLTRGRDANVVYVPQMSEMTETFDHLVAAGFRTL